MAAKEDAAINAGQFIVTCVKGAEQETLEMRRPLRRRPWSGVERKKRHRPYKSQDLRRKCGVDALHLLCTCSVSVCQVVCLGVGGPSFLTVTESHDRAT